ncbi:amidohydrolase [Microbacterium sp.]|uniref:amidohydrolase n=1 Tax=Microbacterium sp. TaxID=51671 RepID=UPI003F94F761
MSDDALLLLTGARVRGTDSAAATTLLVGGETLLVIGQNDLADDVLSTRAVRRIDLDGRILTPGFIDAHVHPLAAELALGGASVTPDSSVDECWHQVRTAATSASTDSWVVVAGYSAIRFAAERITRRELDAVEAEHPVVLINSDRHGALANTAALRASGLLDATSGFLERFNDGSPTGIVNESALTTLLGAVTPPDAATQRRALLDAQRRLHALGVIGWQDAFVGEIQGSPDPSVPYRSIAADGLLTARVSAALGWDRNRGLEQIDELVSRRAELPRGRFSAPAVKIFVDGVHESGTAAMRADYFDASGAPLGHNGQLAIEPDLLRAAVGRLDALDFDVHMHAIGDRAVHEGLDAVAAARQANGQRGTRHQIAHVTFLEAGDAERFRTLDVTMNLQPVWTADDFLDFDQYARYVGPEPMERMSRLADWSGGGIRIAMGSDWPVSTPDPLRGIRAAVRRSLSGDSTVRFEHQALSREAAWRAYTAGSAWSSRLDGSGTLEPGSLADFVVWDGDPFDDQQDASVAQTWVGGEAVHGEEL